MPYSHAQIKDILTETTEKCILPYFRNLTADQIDTKTSDTDFVTIADREAEKYLTDVLRDVIPGSFVLGEEAYSEDASVLQRCVAEKDVWIVDPVDGTGNFKRGEENFCTLLSHVHQGELVGAWIYAPLLKKFAAWKKGEAVIVNGVPVTLDIGKKLLKDMNAGEHIGYGQKQDKAKLNDNMAAFFKGRNNVNSFGIETLMMLENKIDWLTFSLCNPWDIAPCAAMVPASGGKAAKINEAPMKSEILFSRKGAFLASRSPDQWTEIRDAILHDIDWKNYFV